MRTIFGVLGRIRLVAGFYLVVITNRKHVGQISGHDIWRIEEVDLIQFTKTSLHLNLKQVCDESDLLHDLFGHL